jgi:two-component system LytT family response regulator
MSNKIKSLIIDDDPFIRDLLQDKLQLYLPEIEVLATANSGTDGLQKIEQYQPDLIFLDVEMADMTGFEMLTQLTNIPFKTIFITSYSHYAIKAIRFNALDYLVKPIDLGELKMAIQRYKENTTSKQENLQLALNNLKTENVIDHQLILQTQEGELRLAVKHIVRIEGERNYSYIYLTNRKKKLISKTLSDLEEMLEGKGFFRCHKSYLVNGLHIQSYPNSLTLVMTDDAEVTIARRKKDVFREWYEQR